MPDWTDKDTDKLFQDGAEQFDFEYDPAAWEQMEKMLDKARRRRLFWWWFVGLAVLATVGSIVVLDGNRQPANDSSYSNAPTPKPIKELPISKQPTTENNVGQLNESSNAKPPSSQLQVQKSTEENKPTSITSNNQFKLPPKTLQPAPKDNKKIAGATTRQNPEKPGSTSPENQLQAPERSTDFARQQIQSMPLITAKPLLISPDKVALSVHVYDYNLNENETGKKSDFAWIAGIAGGTELSSAGFGDFTRLSWEAGLNMEIRYRQRFGLATGAHFLRLHYDAGAGEYIPPKGFWTRKIPPVSSRGICQALEVPVDFNFYEGGLEQSGFFASAGFRSYLMLKERYYYAYDLPDPDLIRMWRTDRDSRYLFSVGQFSAGYNKVFSKKSILTIAPYIKVPLTGIGHGNVKLYSAGANIRLGFRLK